MSNIHHQSNEPTTSISDHEQAIEADTSAARLLTNEYADQIRSIVQRVLDNPTDPTEYGFSIAKNPTESEFIASEIVDGSNASISIGPPFGALSDMPSQVDPSENTFGEHIRCEYADVIKCHTHPTPDGYPGPVEEVGLSYSDLSDAIPAGDHLTAQDIPFKIYRAQSAVVFTDDIEQLPLSGPGQASVSKSSSKPFIFDQPQKIRPWLHLVERTPKACKMSLGDAKKVHYDSLAYQGETHSERFQDARSVLDGYISEVIVPLAPSRSP